MYVYQDIYISERIIFATKINLYESLLLHRVFYRNSNVFISTYHFSSCHQKIYLRTFGGIKTI